MDNMIMIKEITASMLDEDDLLNHTALELKCSIVADKIAKSIKENVAVYHRKIGNSGIEILIILGLNDDIIYRLYQKGLELDAEKILRDFYEKYELSQCGIEIKL